MTLPIKNKWFTMIKDGIKLEEYRNITKYYISRFEKYLGTEITIILRNGYSRKSPSLEVKVFVSKGTGNPDWGAELEVRYYVLRIRDVKELI